MGPLSVKVVPGASVWAKHLLLGLLLAHGKNCRQGTDKNLGAHLEEGLVALLLNSAEKVETRIASLAIVEDRRLAELVFRNGQASEWRHLRHTVQIDLSNERDLPGGLAQDLVPVRAEVRQGVQQSLACLYSLMVDELVQLGCHSKIV